MSEPQKLMCKVCGKESKTWHGWVFACHNAKCDGKQDHNVKPYQEFMMHEWKIVKEEPKS